MLALWNSTDLGVFPIMEGRTWNQYNNLGLGLRATLLEDVDLIPRIHTVTHKLLTPLSEWPLLAIVRHWCTGTHAGKLPIYIQLQKQLLYKPFSGKMQHEYLFP